MNPLLAVAGSLSGLGPLLVLLVIGLLLVRSFAYTPANDVWTKVQGISGLRPPADGLEHLIYKLVPDTFYPTGGYTTLGLAGHATGKLSKLGLASIKYAVVDTSAGGYHGTWNPADGKLKVWRTKDPAAAGGADLPLQEVASSTNLSAETFYVHIYGPRDWSIDPTTL